MNKSSLSPLIPLYSLSPLIYALSTVILRSDKSCPVAV